MSGQTASSYYRSFPEKTPLLAKLNLLRMVSYWKVVPWLKLKNGRRYNRESILLNATGLVQGSRSGVLIKYEIKNKIATFNISPDQGESYLDYLRGTLSGDTAMDFRNAVHAIATIEAMIKTKFYLTY
jgi:hypothetical protein